MISDRGRVYMQLFIVASMVLSIGVGAYRIGFYEGMDLMCSGTLIIDENEDISCYLGELPGNGWYNFNFSLPVNLSEVVVS